MAEQKKWMRGVLIACLLTLAGFGCQAVADAPNVSLQGLDGKRHHLSEYIGTGKWVVLNIWGPTCPPCVEEMPELIAFYERHRDDKAIVIGVALDFPSFGYARVEEVREFVDDYFVSYPILLADGKIASRIGAGALRGTPTTILFTPDGKLVGKQLGTVDQKGLERFIDNYEKERAGRK